MAKITPDLVEWLIVDPEVSGSWRSFASHLGLNSYIPSLEVNRRNRRSDRDRMKELVVMWQTLRPKTFNIRTLLSVLEKEGLKSMYEWVKLMTEERLRKEELGNRVLEKLSQSRARSSLSMHSEGPRLRVGRAGSCTPRPQSHCFSLPPSPYPWPGTASGTTTPTPSQPLSGRSSRSHSPSRRGVFATLYQPEVVRRADSRKASASPSHTLSSLRHSSYLPSHEEENMVLRRKEELSTIIESPRAEGLRQFQEVFQLYKQDKCVRETQVSRHKSGLPKGAEKYFDNLISMIEESARGLDL